MWSRPLVGTPEPRHPRIGEVVLTTCPGPAYTGEVTAFDQLGTEARDAAGADLDLRTTRELVELMNTADAAVPTAVAGASTQLAALIDAVVARLADGGRLVYAGAGTSGRLAALDAAECGPTFG